MPATTTTGILGLQQDGNHLLDAMKGVASFTQLLDAAKRIVILTGAGISAESGIPTFRGAGGLWRTYQAQELATPQAFRANPSLVWEFYHYRREVVARCQPNPGHFALAVLQRKLTEEGKQVSIVTQNIDRLHQAAGSIDVVELHGSLWLLKSVDEPSFVEDAVRVWEDRRVPLASCFAGKCQSNPSIKTSDIPVSELPHTKDGKTLLRPAVVWFNEGLDPRVMGKAHELLNACDLLLVVGTSSVVYPAAAFAPLVADRGKPVVEINLEATENSGLCRLAIQGKAGEILPSLLGVADEVALLVKDFGGGKKESV
jgi:NAD-dependent deacetylase sirtuin 5